LVFYLLCNTSLCITQLKWLPTYIHTYIPTYWSFSDYGGNYSCFEAGKYKSICTYVCFSEIPTYVYVERKSRRNKKVTLCGNCAYLGSNIFYINVFVIALVALQSGNRVCLQNRRYRIRIPPGCMYVRLFGLYTYVHCSAVVKT
jgi:hypothetical protein